MYFCEWKISSISNFNRVLGLILKSAFNNRVEVRIYRVLSTIMLLDIILKHIYRKLVIIEWLAI